MTETVTVTTLVTETAVLANQSDETVTYVTPVIVTETVVVSP
jgi:hypothetical protein